MKKLKIAQIGIGHDHAQPAYATIKKQTDLFEVIGWCKSADEAARDMKPAGCFELEKEMTVEQILDYPGLDAVVVETDDWSLTEYAQMAADRGLHIQMDKPGAQPQDEFEKLARTVKEKNLVFHLGYMYRYNPAIIEIMEKVSAGEYGVIYSVETHMNCEHPASKRQWLAHFKGGMLYFLGCHLIDLIFRIQGMPEEIIPLSTSTGFDGVTGEDFGMAAFKYKNGVSFAKTSACEPGGFNRRQLVVCGSKKTVEVRPLEWYIGYNGLQKASVRVAEANHGWQYDGKHADTDPFDRYEAMMADFAAMVRGEKENPYTLEYECALHRVILAACGFDIDYKAEIVL